MVVCLGGDEFIVLFFLIDDSVDVVCVVNKLVDVISLLFEIGGYQVFLGVSIGVVVFLQDGVDLEMLMCYVDLVMVYVKCVGGLVVQFFELIMNQFVFECLVLENELCDVV